MPTALCCAQEGTSRLFVSAANPFSGSLTSASVIPVAYKPRQKLPAVTEGVEKTASLATLPLTPSWASHKPSATRASAATSAELDIPGLAPKAKDDEQPGTSKQHAIEAIHGDSQIDSCRMDASQTGTLLDPVISGDQGQGCNLCTAAMINCWQCCDVIWLLKSIQNTGYEPKK